MTTRLPRRSTRSQSRDIIENGTDDDAGSVASTSSHRAPRVSKKPRASVRKVKNPETIAEDDVILEDRVEIANEAEASNGYDVVQEAIMEEKREEMEQARSLNLNVNPDKIPIAPTIANLKSNRLRMRIASGLQIVQRSASYSPPVLILLALILAALLPSPNEQFARKTYVDENALQPGSATVDWGWPQVEAADQIAKQISALAQAPADIRSAFITRELNSIGLIPFNQSYSFRVPGSQGSRIITGINTYARFPAARGDGREAFVLAAAWKSSWDGQNDPDVKLAIPTQTTHDSEAVRPYNQRSIRRTNIRGLASTLVLARYLSGFGHWSKDLIFVFSDGEIEGMQAWASSYFGRDQHNLDAEKVQCGGANIWNALAIDYPSDSFSSIIVKHEGLQGKLPNMDVINTFVRIAQRIDSMPVILSAASEHEVGWSRNPLGEFGRYLENFLWKEDDGAKKYLSGLLNVVSQIGILASGKPSGIHGVFHRYHVDAITVFLRPAPGPYGFHHIGRAVESMTRSMSNLLERLHHSQFFYLLTNPYRFIEVGKYLPVSFLLSAALLILGICTWADENLQAHLRQSTLIDLIKVAIIEEDEEDELQRKNEISLGSTFSSTKNIAGKIGKLEDEKDILSSPTSAQHLSDFMTILVNRSLKRGNLLGSTKLRLIAPLMQIQGKPLNSALRIIVSCHVVGAYVYYIINRAPIDCAKNGLEHCKPLRLLSAATIFASVLILWQARASHGKFYKQCLKNSEAHLPPDLLLQLSTFESSQIRSLARLLCSLVLLEIGMITLAISLVNFSLAFCLSLLLCIPLCSCRLPQSSPIAITVDTYTFPVTTERSISPASNDSDNVEAITSSVASTPSMAMHTRTRLLLQSISMLALSPFALLYIAKVACYLGCPFDARFCNASSWIDWSFDDTILQHHLLGTLLIPFVTMLYVPIVIATSIACALSATS